jgi:myo-inositol-1(or 4)-monophosphatase
VNQYEEYEKFIKEIIVKAGKDTLKYFGKAEVQYTKQHEADIVTQADLASNKIIIDAIRKKFPKHGIISEENKIQEKNKEYTWIIDPLDGTGNFKKDIPIYGVIIALVEKKQIIIGAVYLPYLDQLYFASKGRGAYKNNKRIYCSTAKSLTHQRVTGYIQIMRKRKEKIKLFNESSEKYDYWHSEYGTGAYDMMLVADGKAAAYFSPDLGGGIWDVAAPYLILKESGCTTTNFDGKEWTMSDSVEIIAANPTIHKQIMGIIGVKQ